MNDYIGYGSNATGGTWGQPVEISSLADSGSGCVDGRMNLV